MKIAFNPQLNIKSNKNSKISFKGSFNMPLDAFVPQEPKEKEGPKEVERIKNITRTFKTGSNNDLTHVRMWAMSENDSKTQIPKIVLEALKSTNSDPYEDIFMTGGLTPSNRYFVIFNSYYYDSETDKNSVQYYCLVSNDEKPTKLQKAIIKTFNDNEAKNLLKKGSNDNPYARISDFSEPDSKLFEIFTYGLAAISKEADIDDMLRSNGTPSPVIYTGDGKYTKFKVMKLDLSTL